MSTQTTNAPDSTIITTDVDFNLEEFLAAPGADSVLLPAEQEAKKNNIFNKPKDELEFLNEEEESPASIVDQLVTETQELEEEEKEEKKTTSAGRPKVEKSGLVSFFKKRIDEGEMFTFDDYDDEKQTLDEYLESLSEKDVEELWKENINTIKQDISTKVPEEFFESLPEELQFAAKYVMDGGKDLKGIFQALANVQQTRDLDPTSDNDQETIVRQYLKATNFGDDAEIDEEITTWKDLGALAKKANQFKPKLDAMQEERVQQQLAAQEAAKVRQQEAAEAYVSNVFESLRSGEINGLKLDKKVQSQLYSGLVQAQYESVSGRPTNQLGHLLEKYQFVEPNYPLIAEALWLLSNPEEYRKTLILQGENKAVEETVRKLKTAQADKGAGGNNMDTSSSKPTRKIVRNNPNFFKR